MDSCAIGEVCGGLEAPEEQRDERKLVSIAGREIHGTAGFFPIFLGWEAVIGQCIPRSLSEAMDTCLRYWVRPLHSS